MAAVAVRFLLITVGDRLQMAVRFLETARQFYPQWPVITVAQAVSPLGVRALEQASSPGSVVVAEPARLGMFRARMLALQHAQAACAGRPYVVCAVDDDMELTARTYYPPCVEKAQERGVGFVSAGWMPNEVRLAKWRAAHEFVPQPIVYTGGGMFWASAASDVLLAMPRLAYWSDNTVTSLALYTAGFVNYRYRGSVALHRVCGSGGRKGWLRTVGDARVLPDARWIAMHPSKKGDGKLRIGKSEDVTDAAHAEHRRRRLELLG